MTLPSRLLATPERFALALTAMAVLLIGVSLMLTGYTPRGSHPFHYSFPILLIISGLAASFGSVLSILISLREGRYTIQGLLNLLICGFCSLLCIL